mmetsp:Transcript_69293/g.130303  ORF Transcript_69293/g.130303 Transcript_69293/m.130303 type:complete len:245 (-) Transcript_69293:1964-2698(-)
MSCSIGSCTSMAGASELNASTKGLALLLTTAATEASVPPPEPTASEPSVLGSSSTQKRTIVWPHPRGTSRVATIKGTCSKHKDCNTCQAWVRNGWRTTCSSKGKKPSKGALASGSASSAMSSSPPSPSSSPPATAPTPPPTALPPPTPPPPTPLPGAPPTPLPGTFTRGRRTKRRAPSRTRMPPRSPPAVRTIPSAQKGGGPTSGAANTFFTRAPPLPPRFPRGGVFCPSCRRSQHWALRFALT